LDDILEEVGGSISKIKLLKIDVEVSEIEVLKEPPIRLASQTT